MRRPHAPLLPAAVGLLCVAHADSTSWSTLVSHTIVADPDTRYWALVAARDFGGDSLPDVIFWNGLEGDALRLFENQGGSFSETSLNIAPHDVLWGRSSWQWVGDVNSDGRDDIYLLIGQEDPYPSWWLQGDGGHFNLAPATDGWSFFEASLITLADFNGDGINDIVGGDNAAALALLIGTGGSGPGGSGSAWEEEEVGEWEAMPDLSAATLDFAAGDLNGDGFADIVAYHDDLTAFRTYLGNGTGWAWDAANDMALEWGDSDRTQLVDVSADGNLDLLSVATYNEGDGLYVAVGDGLGGFGALQQVAGEGAGEGDSVDDFVTLISNDSCGASCARDIAYVLDGDVYLLANDGGGGFGSAELLWDSSSRPVRKIDARDLDGDGDDDLVVVDSVNQYEYGGSVFWLENGGVAGGGGDDDDDDSLVLVILGGVAGAAVLAGLWHALGPKKERAPEPKEPAPKPKEPAPKPKAPAEVEMPVARVL